MAWNGGGSTKPPMAYNYVDSHGLNAGLGNSANTTFPAVYDSKPMQVFQGAYFFYFYHYLKILNWQIPVSF